MSDEKKEEKSMRAGQFWIRGTVEDYGMRMCGKKEKRILRVHVPNDFNPKYPNVFNIEVSDAAAEKVKASSGDEVEVTVYAKSSPWKDMVFPSFSYGFCKVLKKAGGSAASEPEKPADDGAGASSDPCPF